MTANTRWGILGTGAAARDFAAGLRALPEATIQAVASRSQDKAAAFAKAQGALTAYGAYADLVEDDAIDIVYVATPNSSHYQDVLLCLSHGKPVLCEKPFMMTAAQAREVAALAREKRLFCMEAMWMRCMPLVQQAKAMIEQGRIGDPLVLTADFGVPAFADPADRFFSPVLGGGALLDRGVYLVSLASFLFGPVIGVSSEAALAPSGVDEQSAIILRHAGGRLALLFSSLSVKSSNTASIMGAGGRITLSEPFFAPEELVVAAQSPPTPRGEGARSGGGFATVLKAIPSLAYAARWLRRVRAQTSIRRPHRGSAYRFEAAEVMRCLNAGLTESPLMPLDESIAIMDVLDRIRALWPSAASRA